MEKDKEFRERVAPIVAADPRYRPAAYQFVAEAVGYTTRRRQDPPAASRHISGQNLLEGFRDLALEQFGCLAGNVLHDWGIARTEDVGNIVFHLVERRLLGASEKDSPTDFADGFAFDEAFARPFRPETVPAPGGLPKIA